MFNNLSFKEIVDYLNNDGEPEWSADVDSFFTLVVIITASIVSPPAAGLLATAGTLADLLGVKDGITQISRRIFDRVTRQKEEGPLERVDRMEIAYHLICYASFFDAVESFFPRIVAKAHLSSKDKAYIARNAAASVLEIDQQVRLTQGLIPREYLTRISNIRFPHPLDNFDAVERKLKILHAEMAKGLEALLTQLAVWDALNDTEKERLSTALRSLPEGSGKYFEAHYIELATRIQDFYIWANFQQHKGMRENLKELSAYFRSQVALAEASKAGADLGFARLADAIAQLPQRLIETQASVAIRDLEILYRSRIDQPIIKNRTFVREDVPLVYPKASELYIPQAFKVLRHNSTHKLESEKTWKSLATRDDLGAFLLSYFSSPYSHSTPLIVLGHPGSGKSLLTSVLSARLISPLYTPIRVELRGTNAEYEISSQIVEQIKKDTGWELSWAALSQQFKEKPALILLDGYDELLQASGKVFGGYLQAVQSFQEQQIDLGYPPVRVVVTSRVTLIDKAAIPSDATILRLLEFDEIKRNQWVSIWNAKNEAYFWQSGVEPFEIPSDDKKIVALAEQPLLLLMLALYDADKNQLKGKKGLDQTLLYDSLLRQFSERELQKDLNFLGMKPDEQRDCIDEGLKRLALVAIGMFNRRSLYITHRQLESDLKYFKLERPEPPVSGKPLSQADQMVGSFFFVRDPKSIEEQENEPDHRIDYTVEFLHNTFGEFLTADFILGTVVDAADSIHDLEKSEKQKKRLADILADVNGQPKEWYVSLMYTPLSSRLSTLEMMRELIKHRLNRVQLDQEQFLSSLDKIINSQFDHMLESNILPAIMTNDENLPFNHLPFLGHLAIYTLNLILLRMIVSKDGYTFDEAAFQTSRDGTKAWDRLMYLWKSWFSLESLEGLAAIVEAKRIGTSVVLKAYKTFRTPSSSSRLNTIFNASLALADNVTASLSSLLLLMDSESYLRPELNIEKMQERFNIEKLDLKGDLLIRHWQILGLHGVPNYDHFKSLLRESSDLLKRTNRTTGDLEVFVRLIGECIRTTKNVYGSLLAQEMFSELVDLLPLKDAFRDADLFRSLYLLISIAKELDESDFIEYQYSQFLRQMTSERIFADPYSISLFTEMLRLARKYNDYDFLQIIYRDSIQQRFRDFSDYPAKFYPLLIIESIKLAEEYRDYEFLRLINTRLKHLILSMLRNYQSPLAPNIDIPIDLTREIVRVNAIVTDQEFLSGILSIMNQDFEFYDRLPHSIRTEIIRFARQINNSTLLNLFLSAYRTRYYQGRRISDLDFSLELCRVAIAFGDLESVRSMYERLARELSRNEKWPYSLEQIINIIQIARLANFQDFLDLYYGNFIKQTKLNYIPIEFAIEVTRLAQDYQDERFIKPIPSNSENRETGTIKMFDGARGYGFIRRNKGGRDIFMHITAIRNRGSWTPIKGREVTFFIVQDKKGLQAQDVTPLE